MERKIGEIFEYNGEWHQCVKGNDCANCVFIDYCKSHSKEKRDSAIGLCVSFDRNDGMHVIFKKLEKVGEPYEHYEKLYQCYKLPMETEIRLLPDNCYPIGKDNLVEIEIKQNKENNMEEKKLNLKPFDIRKAREGKPVCTRDGRRVRIICFNRESIGFPIIALIKNGDTEGVYQFDDKGRSNIDDEERGYDLMMLPEKKEGWVNIYALNTCYSSKEEAEANIDKDYEHEYVRTVKINWEE